MSVKNCFTATCGYHGLYYRYNDYNEDMEFYLTGGGHQQIGRIEYNDASKEGSYIRKVVAFGTHRGLEIARNGQSGKFKIDTVIAAFMSQHMYVQYNYNIRIDTFTIPEGNTYSSGDVRFQYGYGPTHIGTLTAKNTYYGGGYLYQETKLVIDTLNTSTETQYGYDYSYYGLYANQASEVKILGGTVSKYIIMNSGSKLYADNLQITASTEYSVSGAGSAVYAKNHDGVSGSYYNKMEYAQLESDTTTRRTASGLSWKATMTSGNAYYGSGFYWDVAKVAVQANSLVTASIYVNRTGTGIHGGLKIDAGQLTGFASTESYCMGSANTWEQVTVSGTPTEDGIITIQADSYTNGNTSHVLYFDDFSVTQA